MFIAVREHNATIHRVQVPKILLTFVSARNGLVRGNNLAKRVTVLRDKIIARDRFFTKTLFEVGLHSGSD